MTTAKYAIEFDGYEIAMCKKIKLSKKEFMQQLDFLRKQVKETPHTNEYPMTEREPLIKEYEGHTVTVYHFNSGTADTYLTAEICKEGYCFKRT